MSHIPFLGKRVGIILCVPWLVFSILYVPLITECGGDSPPHPQPSRAEQPTDVAVPIGGCAVVVVGVGVVVVVGVGVDPWPRRRGRVRGEYTRARPGAVFGPRTFASVQVWCCCCCRCRRRRRCRRGCCCCCCCCPLVLMLLLSLVLRCLCPPRHAPRSTLLGCEGAPPADWLVVGVVVAVVLLLLLLVLRFFIPCIYLENAGSTILRPPHRCVSGVNVYSAANMLEVRMQDRSLSGHHIEVRAIGHHIACQIVPARPHGDERHPSIHGRPYPFYLTWPFLFFI